MSEKDASRKITGPGNATPVGKLARSLPELVAEEMLNSLRDGTLQPGERLKEETFAEQYAVSRSTIREAISLLERRGIVERLPRYGARVVAIDQEEIEEIFAIRGQLLGLAARITAETASDEMIATFERHVSNIEELAKDAATDPAHYGAASIEAQRLLISSWKGKRLRAMYEELSDATLWRFAVRERATSFQSPERRRESARDWRRVATAIASRDGDRAEQFAKELLGDSYRAVKEQLGP